MILASFNKEASDNLMHSQLVSDLKNTVNVIESNKDDPLRRAMRKAVGYDVNFDPLDSKREQRINDMISALKTEAEDHDEVFRPDYEPVPRFTLLLIRNVIEQDIANST